MGRYGYGDRNERGERLLEFATVHNLYICYSEISTETKSKMDLGIARWYSQEYDRLDSHSAKMEDVGHQLSNISERTHKLRSLASPVQYQATTQ